MRYEISEHNDDVEIQIHQPGGQTPQVLASLEDCQQGRCGCPTDQYDRLEDMAIHTDAEQLTIHLHPHDGQRFDTKQLEACLDYTLDQAESGTE